MDCAVEYCKMASKCNMQVGYVVTYKMWTSCFRPAQGAGLEATSGTQSRRSLHRSSLLRYEVVDLFFLLYI